MSSININKRFGNKIKQYRDENKMSQFMLGKLLSYTQAEISKIENGKRDITISKFAYINSILHLIEFTL